MHIYTIALVKAGTALVAKVVETELMKDNDTGVRVRGLLSENIIRKAVIHRTKAPCEKERQHSKACVSAVFACALLYDP